MIETEKILSQTKEFSADEIVQTGTKTYTEYLIVSKLPHYLDGLKQVHRRILWVLRNNNGKVKITQPVASATAIHPHGDSSILDAASRLTQEFSIGEPLITSLSDEGSYSTPKAVQARYFDITLAEFSKDLFFRDISPRVFHMIPNYDFREFEPEYFIPKIPTSLLFTNLTVGFGFFSNTNPLNLNNICELIQKFIDFKNKSPNDTFNFENHPHLFIPDFPIDNIIRNYDELIENYKNGNYDCKIAIDGTLELFKNKIEVYTLPFGNSFEETMNDLITKSKIKTFWLNSLITNNGLNNYVDDQNKSMTGRFTIDVKNSINIFKALSAIKKTLNFCTYKRPIANYVKNSNIFNFSPPELFKYWYEARINSIVVSIKEKQVNLTKEKFDLQAQLIVLPKIDEVIALTRNHKGSTYAELATAYMDMFKENELSMSQAMTLAKMNLYQLSQGSEIKFNERLNEIKKEIDTNNNKFKSMDDIIYNDAEYIKKKYKRKRKTVFNKFMGYLKIGNDGIIQYYNEEDMFTIINNFNNEKIKIYPYTNMNDPRYLVENGKVIISNLDVPRHAFGEEIISQSKKEKNTIFINPKFNTIFYSKGAFFKQHDNIAVNVNKYFYAIKNNGYVNLMSIDELTTRKDINSRGNKTDIIYAIPDRKSNIFIVHMSEEQPNVLRVEKILESEVNPGRITIPATGKTHILGTLSQEISEFIFNIPTQCLSRLNVEFIKFRDIISLMNDKQSLYIELGRTTKDVKMTRHPHCKSMLVI